MIVPSVALLGLLQPVFASSMYGISLGHRSFLSNFVPQSFSQFAANPTPELAIGQALSQCGALAYQNNISYFQMIYTPSDPQEDLDSSIECFKIKTPIAFPVTDKAMVERRTTVAKCVSRTCLQMGNFDIIQDHRIAPLPAAPAPAAPGEFVAAPINNPQQNLPVFPGVDPAEGPLFIPAVLPEDLPENAGAAMDVDNAEFGPQVIPAHAQQEPGEAYTVESEILRLNQTFDSCLESIVWFNERASANNRPVFKFVEYEQNEKSQCRGYYQVTPQRIRPAMTFHAGFLTWMHHNITGWYKNMTCTENHIKEEHFSECQQFQYNVEQLPPIHPKSFFDYMYIPQFDYSEKHAHISPATGEVDRSLEYYYLNHTRGVTFDVAPYEHLNIREVPIKAHTPKEAHQKCLDSAIGEFYKTANLVFRASGYMCRLHFRQVSTEYPATPVQDESVIFSWLYTANMTSCNQPDQPQGWLDWCLNQVF